MGSRTRVVLVSIALTVAAEGCGRSNANRTETTMSQDGSAGAVAGDARNDAGTDAFVDGAGAAADAGNDPNVVDASA